MQVVLVYLQWFRSSSLLKYKCVAAWNREKFISLFFSVCSMCDSTDLCVWLTWIRTFGHQMKLTSFSDCSEQCRERRFVSLTQFYTLKHSISFECYCLIFTATTTTIVIKRVATVPCENLNHYHDRHYHHHRRQVLWFLLYLRVL